MVKKNDENYVGYSIILLLKRGNFLKTKLVTQPFIYFVAATIGAPDISTVEIGKDHVLLDVKAPATPYTHIKDGNTSSIRMDDFFVSISYRATLKDIPSKRRRRRKKSMYIDRIQSNSGWFRFEQLTSGTEYLMDVSAYLEYQEGDTVSFYVETQGMQF